jgi:hypothetical protein
MDGDTVSFRVQRHKLTKQPRGVGLTLLSLSPTKREVGIIAAIFKAGGLIRRAKGEVMLPFRFADVAVQPAPTSVGDAVEFNVLKEERPRSENYRGSNPR